MNNTTLFQLLAICLLSMSIAACGGETAQQKEESAPMKSNNAIKEKKEGNKTGPEYTSMYICPMHCEGSGSEEPGQCPVCGMDYELNEDFKGEKEMKSKEEEHDHSNG